MSGDYEVDARRYWAGAVVVALIGGLAALVTQVVIEVIIGDDLLIAPPGGAVEPLSPLVTFAVAAATGLVGMGLLHLFLVTVPRGRTLWGLLASLVLLASILPVVQLDTGTSNKVLLVVVHLATYLFIVPVILGIVPRVATPIRR